MEFKPPLCLMGRSAAINQSQASCQGSSAKCGYLDYRIKATYGDDRCFAVTAVEILERITP
jgi:hypothetical protein